MNRLAIRFASVLVLALTAAVPLSAQPSDPGTLTLERIFASAEFQGERFGPASWLEGEAAYTTVEPSATVEGGSDIVRYDAASGEREVWIPASRLVPAGAREALEVEDYAWSPAGGRVLIFTNSARVWRDNTRGDYWILDRDSGNLRKLGGDAPESTLMFAKFSPDGSRVGYVRYDENDIYVEDLESGEITRLTTDGSRTVINGTFDWVYEEELNLQDGWRWSPDGERIAYWQLDASGVGEFLLLNTTDSLYSFTIPIQYPKAGTTNSAARVGVVGTGGGETVWMDVPGDPRNNYIARMEWAASPDELVIQHLNRLQNTLQIMLADASTGAVRTVHTESDPDAWVDMRIELFEWIDDGLSFLWISESDGWRHAYVISRDGADVRPITPGDYDIIDVVGVDTDEEWLYFLASPDDPRTRYLYRARVDGAGEAERLTPDQTGTHAYDMAPSGRWAIHTFSSFGVPPVIDLVALPAHEPVRTMVENAGLRAAVEALDRGPMEFFRVPGAEAGLMLDGWVMKPPGFDESREYPVLFYVYGEPWGQTVEDSWDGETYLWHLYLTQQGYLVASVDPRGTPAPRGSEWRKVIYQRIGTLTAADLAAAAEAFVGERPWVDENQVGIWGWSGGGSQTLNALFRYPDVFDLGMAVAPVPDVGLYDTIYQERYMGLPQESPEAYRESSPITWADRLQGDLLIVHGTGDDNVHFQGTERLINALVLANKPFTMMAYPNRTHGIFEGKNTTLHLYSLLTRYLEEHLPAEAPEPVAVSR
ncbi:MAG TPA: S9 family peptidase [Gemmatimonadota bacterium]|nr:S9 family peptidase [Gemmatimonadota bacterium]